MKNSSTFWSSIKNNSGWSWALNEIKRNPTVMKEKGLKFNETPLHWALLSHTEATMTLCLEYPHLLAEKDEHGRTPMDWALEKYYFLKEESLYALPDERAKKIKMMKEAEQCLWCAMNWVDSQELKVEWTGDINRFIQCSLSAGYLEWAKKAVVLTQWKPDASIVLSGLAGLWSQKEDVSTYLRWVKDILNIQENDIVFNRPLGLHVAHLWVNKGISTERAIWFHENHCRLDSETENESMEVFCAEKGDKASADWDALRQIIDV